MTILIASEILKGGNPTYTHNEAEDLEIIGDIPDGAKIKIESQGHSGFPSFSGNVGGTSFHNCFSAGGRMTIRGVTSGQRCANLTITGNVGKIVNISSEGGYVIVNGDVGEKAVIKTSNGEITAKNIGEDAVIKTSNGRIIVQDVNRRATVTTSMGNINANIVHEGATIKTSRGKVKIYEDRRSTRRSSQRNRSSNASSPFHPNFGANLRDNILSSVSAALGQEDYSTNTRSPIPQRWRAQPTATQMGEDLPPAYSEGAYAAAASNNSGLPPAYSEEPRDGEVRVASNLNDDASPTEDLIIDGNMDIDEPTSHLCNASRDLVIDGNLNIGNIYRRF